MAQVAQQMDNETNKNVEIVVHVSEDLDDIQRNNLVSALKSTNGIADAEFCPLRYHLMLVRYDRDSFSSKDVLSNVNMQNVHARLIGPI